MTGVARAATVNFDKTEVGNLPPNWTGTKTGTGEPQWAVVADESAPSKPNVLKQSGVATYPVCIKEDTKLKDGYVEVKFKSISGKEDQAGGPIWRAKDEKNYYVARWNPLETNLRVYYVKDGKRTQIANADVTVDPKAWHEIEIKHVGTKITAGIDGKKLIEVEDRTFAEAGKIGLWTKADAATAFDDIAVKKASADDGMNSGKDK